MDNTYVDSFDIFHYIKILQKRWKIILVSVSTSMFLTFIFLLIRPTVYVSVVSLLLPEATSAQQAYAIGSLLGLGSLPGGGSSKGLILGILQSKRMKNDVKVRFGSELKPTSWWKMSTYDTIAGLALEVKGPDPALTEKIANFYVENLDKINTELQITTEKPMVKVLDPAVYGAPQNKKILRKAFIVGMSVLLLVTMSVYFMEYHKSVRYGRKVQ